MACAKSTKVWPADDPHGLLACGMILDLMLECCAAFVVGQAAKLQRGGSDATPYAGGRMPVAPG